VRARGGYRIALVVADELLGEDARSSTLRAKSPM